MFQSQSNNQMVIQPQAQNILNTPSNQYMPPHHDMPPLQYNPSNEQAYHMQSPRPAVLPNNTPIQHPTNEYVNQSQSYPHNSKVEVNRMHPQSAGNIENNLEQSSYNYKTDSSNMSHDIIAQSDSSAPPHTVPIPLNNEANIPSASQDIKTETAEVNQNSTQLFIVHNELQEDIDRDISEAAEDVTAVTQEESEREGAPLDPNLVCPMCMKQYRLGEIQLFRAHVNKCDGTRQNN